MIAIIGTNKLENPEDIESAILPNGRVLIAKDADEFRRTGLESLLDNYREDAKRDGDEKVSTASILEQFAHRSNNGYAEKSNVWLFEDGGFEGYKPISEARELIKEAGLR